MQVNILEAKNNLSALLRRVKAGEEVIIANRGEPMVKLVPTASVPENRHGNPARWLKANPLPAHLQRSAAELDAAIAAERESWD